MEDIRTIEKKVNRLAELMCSADPEKDAALIHDARLELWELLYGVIVPRRFIGPRLEWRKETIGYEEPLYEDGLWEAALDTIEYCLGAFDPSLGYPFMNLFSKTIALRLTGAWQETVEEDRQKAPSLDTPIDSEEESFTVLDTVRAGETSDDAGFTFGAYLDGMAAIVRGLFPSSWQPGSRMSRPDWYSLFLTEYVTMLSQKFSIMHCSHMRDLFAAMMLPYQDYYSKGKYRSLKEIANGQLKPMGLLNPYCDPEERDVVVSFEENADAARLMFPAAISLCYLGYWKSPEDAENKLGASGRSNYLREFKTCLKDAGLGAK